MAIFVFAESHEGKYKKAGLEAVSYAKVTADLSGDTVTAIVFGDSPADELYKYGASKVLKIQNDVLNKFDANSYAKALAEVAQGDIIILPSTNEGATIAPILAYKTGASLVTNVEKAPSSVSPFTVARKSFSGKGIETVSVTGKIVITILQNSFGIKESQVSGTEEVASISVTDSDVKVKVISTDLASSNKIDLKEADIVVSAGRGMKGPENWGIIEDLASVLGAATASSKPVADVGWRPHAEHVGQTGKAIAPKLYIAIGISGAIQHLAGVNGSKTIVVINNDPEAPFFKSADYGIVGDAFDVVPKLTEELKKFKG